MAAGTSVCPGCGLSLPSRGLDADRSYNASGECRSLDHELSYYTLAHRDPQFIHQHAVDAYAAQHVKDAGRPISAAFALAGLYLTIEKGFTGRQVQQMHMRMGTRSRQWPRFLAPRQAGALTVADVLGAEPGPLRDQALLDWCRSVWAAWSAEQERVGALVRQLL